MSYNLTLTNATFNASGKFGQSMNGGNGYTTVSPITSYPITIQAWIKAVASSNVEVIAGRAACGWFGKAANNTAVAHYGAGGAGTADGSDVTLASSTNITDGAWHFLELVVTANGGYFFVDGVLVNSSTSKPNFPTDNQYFGARAFFLGINSSTATFPFQGEIDELAVFNTALHTATYTPPTAPYVGNEAGLAALYHFDGVGDDSVGTTLPPNAPTIGLATSGDGTITVNFTPASTGSSATSYTLYVYNANTNALIGTAPASGSPAQYSGNINGVPVYGKISGTNGGGEGGLSTQSNTVTPAAVAQQAQIAYNNGSVYWSPYNWDDRGTYKVSNCPGAYLKFTFTGTSVAIKFDVSAMVSASMPGASYPIVRTIVDGILSVDTQLTSGSSTVTRTGLASGTHTIEMHFLATDINNGERWSTPVNALRITGFTLDAGGVVSASPVRSKVGLHYGDSITEGYLSNGTVSTQPNGNNSMTTVSPALAQAFDYEYGVVAFSGQGYEKTGNGGVPALPSAYNYYSAGRLRLVNTLLFPAPDYILVEHGANGTTTSGDVQAFIGNLRAIAPNAKIIQLVPAGGFARTAITAGFNAAADSNSMLVDLGTSYQLGIQLSNPSPNLYSLDGLHRNQLSNERVATAFAKKIQAALDGVVTTTTSARTFSTQLYLDASTPAASLTGLKIRCYNMDGSLAYTNDTGTSDASGNISVVAQSTASSGASCLMTVRNAGHHWSNFVTVT